MNAPGSPGTFHDCHCPSGTRAPLWRCSSQTRDGSAGPFTVRPTHTRADLTSASAGMARYSDGKDVPGIDVLVVHEDLVDVVGMGRAIGQRVANDLKRVSQPCGIVDVDVRTPVIAIGKERQLQVSVVIGRFVAPGGSESVRRVMKRPADLGKEAGRHGIFRLLAQ